MLWMRSQLVFKTTNLTQKQQMLTTITEDMVFLTQYLKIFQYLTVLVLTGVEDSSLEDQEHSAIGVSYTNGSMTISGSMHEGDNLQGSSAAANDKKGYELNIGFAF